MSDLVERVAQAMYTSEEWSSFWGEDDAKKLARAAIAAVAKWLDEQPLETGHEPYDMAIAKLWKQLEKSK